MYVVCCVDSGLCYGLIIRSEESYGVCLCPIGCDSESSNNEAAKDRFWTVAPEKKQDRQCTYNVTLKRVRATIVVVEKQ